MKKTLLTIAIAASAFTFSNCANPYAPGATNAQRDTATGALLGGAAGAIIGHQSGRGLEGAAIGAAAGGIGGNMIGRNKDAQYYR
jgi:uncharacterized protein YcfJ